MPAFEVDLPTLRTTATSLDGDAASITTAGTDASSAAGEAGAACDGGALATALRAFATEIAARTESASADAGGAGTTLTGNADRYAGDDSSARGRLDAAADAFDSQATPGGNRWVRAQ